MQIPRMRNVTRVRPLGAIGVALALTTACSQPAGPAAEAIVAGDTNVPTQITETRRIHLTVPQGTQLTVELAQEISSEFNLPGDPVAAVVMQDCYEDGRVVIPRNSIVRGTVTNAHAQRGIGGDASLAFTFDTLETPDGNTYPIEATFARIRNGSPSSGESLVVMGRVVEPVARGNPMPDNSGFAASLAGVGGAMSPALAANVAGLAIELPPGTALRVTLRAPTVVQVEEES